MTEIRDRLLHSPIGDSIAHIFQPEGFSFIGTSENVGIVFLKLKTWSERSQTAMQLIPQINRLLSDLPDAQVFATDPPTIRGLSQFGGVDMYLQARTGQSRAQLAQAVQTLLAGAAKDSTLSGIRQNSLPNAPQLELRVDRNQAQTMGLSLTDVYNTVQTELAPHFVNQFTYAGRVKKVYVQADAPFRMGLDALDHLYTPSGISSAASGAPSASAAATNTSGYLTPVDPSAGNSSISPYNMIPLSSVVKTNWISAPLVLPRYNGYSAIEIVGNSAAGYSTGPGDAGATEHRRPEAPAGLRC